MPPAPRRRMMVYRLANLWPGSRIGPWRTSVVRPAVAPVRRSDVSASRVSFGAAAPLAAKTDRGTGVWQTTHLSIVGDVAAPQYVQSIGGVSGRVEDYPSMKSRNKEQYTRPTAS